jgi:predicted phage tail protein
MTMAELTTLEEKLAEVIGLAEAAHKATEKVEGLVDDDSVTSKLQQMREEAEETARRGTEIAERRDGKKTAILEKAKETKGEASEMMETYLGDDADGLDGFEFMTMAEAGEVGHWAVLQKLNEQAGEEQISELVQWALPIQERHFSETKECALQLAGEKDPYEEA